MKELIRIRVQYASRQQCCKTHQRPLPLPFYTGTTYAVSSGNCPSFSCFSIVFFNSAGSDVLQKKTTTFSHGHPVRRIWHHAISFFGSSLKTVFTYHHCPCPSRNFLWSDNACTADHYSGHAAPSLGWIWLTCGCVSCDPGCTHWRIVINGWETWTFAVAVGVCCARVRWEIILLLTFETAPFIFVYPVLSISYC